MNLSPDQYALDFESYRAANGRHALFSYLGPDGKLQVVKRESDVEVVLHGVFDNTDRTVTPAEFAANYQMVVQDEAVFLFGSKQQQESARQLLEAESAAVKRCVYGKTQLPAVIA